MSTTQRFSLALAACAVLAACERGQPLAPSDGAPPVQPTYLAALHCTATIATGAVACESAPPGTGAASGLVVGGQGTYVSLQATGTVFDPVEATFTMDVTVQNLIPQPLGTEDGSALHADGVRVFFNSGPVGAGGAVVLLNADDTGFFLSAGQPYFQWSEMLAENQTSGARSWEFGLQPGVTSFSFTAYVAAQVPFPQGWVDLGTAADTLLEGSTAGLTPVARRLGWRA
jgi:hypothetical protein